MIDLREDWKVKGKKHVGEYINDMLIYPVQSKNPNAALGQELRASPLPIMK